MLKPLTAYAVHVLTASGVLFALLAMLEVASTAPDPRWVFTWLAITVLIDAADGPLARRVGTKRHAAAVDGRTIDDILDYITYTFIPLLLVLRMSWLIAPAPIATAVVGFAMLASLFGFAHRLSKDERHGFFRGFPSYWNVLAYYFGLWVAYYGAAGQLLATALVCLFAVVTVLPVRFLYLNLTPRPWKAPMMIGAALWALLLVGMLPWYPHPGEPQGAIPEPLMWISLVYPAVYVLVSVHLHRRLPRTE